MPRGNRIRVDIDGNEKGLRASLKRATGDIDRNAKRWQRSISGLSRGFAGILAGAGAGIAGRELNQLAESSIRAADELGKAAKTAGISAEALQEYREAAELTGTTQKQLDDAVGRFTRRLGEARRGNKEYEKTFAELGVTIEDTQEQALQKVFNALADTEDITIRTSRATKVFGDDARRMALLVEDGAEGLLKLRNAAREGGRVLSNELVAGAEDANDKLTIMEANLRTKLNKTVLENVDGFIKFRQLLNDVQIATVKLTASIGDLSGKGANLAKRAGVQLLEAELRSLEDQPVRNPAINAEIERLKNEISRIKGEIKNLPKVTLADIDALVGKEDETPPNPNAFAGGKIPPAPTLKQNAFAEAAERAKDKINELFEQTRTPLEALRGQLSEIEALRPFAETPADLDAIKRAAAATQKQIGELKDATNEWQRASEAAARGVSDAFANAIVFGDNLLKSLKRLSQQLASRLISNFLFNAITDNGAGGVLKLFGGGRAAGGPVTAGKTYLVGERGPELFSPSQSGSIIPNGAAIGGGAVNVDVHNHFDVGLESVDTRIAQATPTISASVYDAIERARNRPRFS